MNKKEEIHDAVLESITTALLQLMEKKKLKDIRVSELCDRAGVSRVSFYRNYRSMEDILKKHLRKITDDWWAGFNPKDDQELYRNFLPELMEQYRKNKEFIDLLYQNHSSHIIKDHLFDICDPNPEREDVDSYRRAVLAGSLYGLLDEWIRRGMKPLPEGFHLNDGKIETPQ